MEHTENIQKTNEKFARFLGWKLGHPELLELRWSNEWFDENRTRMTKKGFLFFHEEYNWLMKVVEKIESFRNEREEARFNVDIEQCFVCISECHTSREIVDLDKDTKFEAIYTACDIFIDWYERTQKTLEQSFERLLIKNGLEENQAGIVLGMFVEAYKEDPTINIEVVLKQSASDYPLLFQKVLLLSLKKVALDFINKHLPEADFRDKFL